MRVRQGEKCCGSMAPLKTQFEAHRTCLLSTQKSPVCGHSSFLPHLLPSALCPSRESSLRSRSPGRAFSLRALPVEALRPLLGRSFGWVGSASMLPLSDSRSSFGKASSCPFGFPPGFVHPVGFPPVSGVMSRSSLSEFCLVCLPVCVLLKSSVGSTESVLAAVGHLEVSLVVLRIRPRATP